MLLGAVDVRAAGCDLATRADARDANAAFGSELRLVEVAQSRAEGTVDLTLYWHAEYRMPTDYKVFVHVFDPATGIPAAQSDAMPCNWTYPTSRWWPGEVVVDRVSIALQGVPAGQYGIAVGVYDPATGTRLPLVDGAGVPVPDGRLVLPDLVEVE